jgi:hypothetical protein
MAQNKTDGSMYRDYSEVSVPLAKCSKQSAGFNKMSEEELKSYPIDWFYCPTWNNLTLQGNYHSSDYKFMFLRYKRC